MASLTELTYSGTISSSTLFYAVLDAETSAISRSTSLVDMETAMTNKLNTLANQGTGFPLFRERSSGSGVLRTLVGGNNISLSSATSTVTIANDHSSQAATNLGDGGYGLYKETQANTHQFKTIAAGTNITLGSAASTVTINSTGGGGGEANLGDNLGTGIEVFREKSSVTLNFRSLVGGNNISLSSATSTITIDSDSASQAAANLGSGGFGVYRETQSNTHHFKTLTAGANITLGSSASTISIAATGAAAGEANLGGNLGTGIEVFREKSSVTLNFRTLAAGKDMALSSATSLVTIANAASEHHFSVTIGASNTWNNELIPIWQAPRGGSATLVEILATTSGTGAVSFNLQNRDWDAMQSAGADIFAASQTATSAGEQITSFTRDTIDPRAHLMFTTGSGAESGSVSYLQVSVYYTA